ncbi:MAG: hydroxyacid dehydrogenase [Candidatus Firestonebacteria bacterium]|nr:hydroxyacid dehydrogenase [Candidatus Firestonebacteria bacterium]
MKPKIWITLTEPNYKRYISAETEKKLYSIAEVIDSNKIKPDAAKVAELIKTVDGIITWRGGFSLTPEQVKSSQNLKMIGFIGSAVRHVSTEAAYEKGIIVTNSAGGIGYTVAEFTVGMMITALHRVYESMNHVRIGKWSEGVQMGKDLQSKNIGLIGVGAVGANVVTLLKPFYCTIRAYDPYLPKKRAAELGITLTSKEEVIKTSDVISLHAGLTPETKHMLGEKEFAMMKPGVLIINNARGGLIDHDAMLKALKADKIQAALDVFDPEPLPEVHEYRTVKNCYPTAHTPGNTVDSSMREGKQVVEDFELFFNGKMPLNNITKEKLARMT